MSAAVPLPASTRTLDVLVGIALLAALFQAVSLISLGSWQLGVWSAGFVVVAALVHLVRRGRRDRGWTSVAFFVAALGVWGTGSGLIAILVLLVALLLVRLDHGLVPTVAAGALALVAAATLMALAYGRSAGFIVGEMLALALVVLPAIWVADVVAGSYRSRHEAEVAAAERDRAMAALEESNRALTETNAALAASIETEKELVLARERARAAGELHDGLGHRLTAIRLGLDFVDRTWAADPKAAHAEVVNARDATVEALRQMRIWVRALNPGPHTAAGDAQAFEAIADAFRGTGLEVTITVDGLDEPLPLEVSLFAHRFIQEGLTNAVRHGEATQVVVDLARTADVLRIRLSDNGSGSGPVVEGFGLRSLRERASALGGELVADPGPDGFTLQAQVPAGVAASSGRSR